MNLSPFIIFNVYNQRNAKHFLLLIVRTLEAKEIANADKKLQQMREKAVRKQAKLLYSETVKLTATTWTYSS